MKAGVLIQVISCVVVGALVCGCSERMSVEAERVWKEACSAYAETNYAKASRLFRKLEGMGYKPGELYYNLGNAYYRQGELGQAICAYRQAQWLLPRDGDVAANLATARRAAKEQLVKDGVPEAVKGFLFFYYHVSPDESVWIFAVVSSGLFGGLALNAFLRWGWLRQVLRVMGVVWVVLGLSAGIHIYRLVNPREGVVVAEQAEVRSGPSERETVLFALHDGAEVEILGHEGGWYKIKAGGQKGWIGAENVSVISVWRR